MMSMMKMLTFVNSWHWRELKTNKQYLAIQNPALMIATLTEDAVFEEDVDVGIEDEVFLLNVVLLIVKKRHQGRKFPDTGNIALVRKRGPISRYHSVTHRALCGQR